MKKLALTSAIATATMMSAGAYAQPTASAGSISINSGGGYIDITVPCASTWSGGADGIVYDLAGPTTVSGTVCIDPTGSGTPYVMVGISMSDSGTALTMDRGAIQISTNWSTTSGWIPYGVIDVSVNPVSCMTGLPNISCSLLPYIPSRLFF